MTDKIKPQDIMPDSVDTIDKAGVTIRKGTMAAVIENAAILTANDATEADKQTALEAIRDLAPALITFGITEHVSWKNPQIQAIFDEVAKSL